MTKNQAIEIRPYQVRVCELRPGDVIESGGRRARVTEVRDFLVGTVTLHLTRDDGAALVRNVGGRVLITKVARGGERRPEPIIGERYRLPVAAHGDHPKATYTGRLTGHLAFRCGCGDTAFITDPEWQGDVD